MLTTHPNSFAQKRDLHVGGLGSSATGALAAVTDPVLDAAYSWFDRTRDVVRDADEYVHHRPWSAIAIATVVGVTAGFLLSRRPTP